MNPDPIPDDSDRPALPRPDAGSADARRRTHWRAALLREDMEAAGVRPGELAEMLGVSPQVVANWRRVGAIHPKHLREIADVLDRPVERYLSPDAVQSDATSAPRAGGVPLLRVRAFLQAGHPAVGAARQALEGGRRFLVAVSLNLSAEAFAVELARGIFAPTGTATGGTIVVDPGRPPQPGALLLMETTQHGPAIRRCVIVDGEAFTVPVVDVGGLPQPLADARFLGSVLEFHPSPTVF